MAILQPRLQGSKLPELRKLRRAVSPLRRMLTSHRDLFDALSRPDFRPQQAVEDNGHFVAASLHHRRRADRRVNAACTQPRHALWLTWLRSRAARPPWLHSRGNRVTNDTVPAAAAAHARRHATTPDPACPTIRCSSCWRRCRPSTTATSRCSCRCTGTASPASSPKASTRSSPQPPPGRRPGARRPEGRPRRPDPPAHRPGQPPGRVGGHGAVGQRPDRRPGAPDRNHDRGDGRRGQGRPHPHRAAGSRRPPAAGRVPALGEHRQPHDRADGRVLARKSRAWRSRSAPPAGSAARPR